MTSKNTHKLFGISNCDTVKKARRWLEQNNIVYEFVDFRIQGLSAKQVTAWTRALGLDTLLNKRSTTWKNLSDGDKAALSGKSATQVLLDNPTLIKRPLLETADGHCQVGFAEAQYRNTFK